jgi:serine/threonine-protein kinase RsbW
MDKPSINGNTIVIPSNAKYLNAVDDFVEGFLREYGTGESVVADIAISVSELVNNAIIHGNKVSEDAVVTISVERDGDSVIVSVTDEGGGFNLTEIDDPLKDENLMKEVGRGIFIVESLMDKVEITPSENGTTVSISKKIA